MKVPGGSGNHNYIQRSFLLFNFYCYFGSQKKPNLLEIHGSRYDLYTLPIQVYGVKEGYCKCFSCSEGILVISTGI